MGEQNDHDAAIAGCRSHVLLALTAAMSQRTAHDDWIERERVAVAIAANAWAQAHGYQRLVTVTDIERIESNALGHIDYATKLALYVAEFVVDPAPWQLAHTQDLSAAETF